MHIDNIFDRWLGAIIGFAFLQLFIIMALTLALSLAYWWVGGYVGEQALNIGNTGTLPSIIIGIICIGLISKATSFAYSLQGVIVTSAETSMMGSKVGNLMGVIPSARLLFSIRRELNRKR